MVSQASFPRSVTLPQLRSCPHLVLLSYELFIWYNDPLVERTGTKHTGLSPDKITPMLGVLAPKPPNNAVSNGASSPAAG